MVPTGDVETPAIAARLDRVIEAYEPLPGVLDECMNADGSVRPHWQRFFAHFLALPPGELKRRFTSADRHMRDTGVTYRAYGDADDRPWPLSHVPLLIGAAEWEGIAAGVAQRARVAEALLADVYGPNRLIQDGLLPAAAVAGSPDFLHPAQGVVPAGNRFLSLYAVDLGRGPDGRWWVLGDRTQAPSGAGYALENRLALSRAFAELYGSMNVDRLAPFFQAFRAGLVGLAERVEPRICLLTPGPLNETYFEHAYLARYLGFLLVEGGDLVVRDGQVHIRTIAGLKRADVLLRRIDADYADPLELNGHSRLGVPGLMEAVRGSRVAVANALGAGLIEARSVMSMLPGLASALIDEELLLPSLATYWCGTDKGRATVLSELDTMMISGAFRERTAEMGLERPTPASQLNPAQVTRLRALIDARGIDYAAQEIARLSTTPVWDGTRFVPRPFVLRVFAAATADGWRIMPGGFCRVANQPDANAISMSAGVQSADVWVLADKPVEALTLLPNSGAIRIRRLPGNLPSRAADNLFWLGRYLERTEGTLRMVRCLCGRLIEAGVQSEISGFRPSLDKLLDLLVRWGALSREGEGGMLPHAALYDPIHYGSAVSLAREVQRTASIIRERLSVDATSLIQTLVAQLTARPTETASENDLFERADRALQFVAAISGLSQENINRVEGWRFLEMGRRIERAVATCRFARAFAGEPGPAADLDVLLDLIDSQITYRSRYLIGVALAPIRDMAMLDPYNPRSVAFQIERLAEHIASLPAMRSDGLLERPNSLVRQLSATMATIEAKDVGATLIDRVESDVLALSGAIADRYFLQGASAARPDKWTGLG